MMTWSGNLRKSRSGTETLSGNLNGSLRSRSDEWSETSERLKGKGVSLLLVGAERLASDPTYTSSAIDPAVQEV